MGLGEDPLFVVALSCSGVSQSQNISTTTNIG
jgi:hypothetical protein